VERQKEKVMMVIIKEIYFSRLRCKCRLHVEKAPATSRGKEEVSKKVSGHKLI